MPAVEFIVAGPVVSGQTKNPGRRQDFIKRAEGAARAAMAGRPMLEDAIRAKIVIVTAAPGVIDDDNVEKLLRDCMQGVVYANDRTVISTSRDIRSLDDSFKLKGTPVFFRQALFDAISNLAPFIYVYVTNEFDSGVIW